MKTRFYVFCMILCACILTISCAKEKHFLTDAKYREEVHEQFLKREQMVSGRHHSLFAVFNRPDLTLAEKEALEFLYAYMPLSDLGDYDGTFFLKQVRASLQARDTFAWGQTIPEDIFRHFVLVYRVNNENLDTARLVFFNELKDRVKGLSMTEAALEVNLWCRGKVTYRGTDGRTSAPLATVRTSWGRCGEESTFTVTAMRAVGIPARQCYTPRWVHSDNNHAWVEVWVDGQWHFLGACEPEPELDHGWFAGPATRTMMVHTIAFGKYTGTEPKNIEKPLFSRINLLANYADTRQVKVKIVDLNGNPVPGAKVQFKVYNYAELFTISENETAPDGTTAIFSGMGDLMIWANKDNLFGYGKSKTTDEETVIVLDHGNLRLPNMFSLDTSYTETYVINIPPGKDTKGIDEEKLTNFGKRVSKEDAIRSVYTSTFAKEEDAEKLSTETGLDSKEIFKYLQLSQGNWRDIADFIRQNKDNPRLFPFLAAISKKDLRDTPREILEDHFLHCEKKDPEMDETLFVKQVLSPRIALELIRPWRAYFQQPEKVAEIAGTTPSVENIIQYINKNITINDDENYYLCPISPVGVYELKMADRHSRDIFFAAVCRSMGIPAQVEPATGKPRYYKDGKWFDVVFEHDKNDNEASIADTPKGTLILENDKENGKVPGYYTHYTIAKYKDGEFQTLDFEEEPSAGVFPCTLTLDAGYYRLMTGARDRDGSPTVRTVYFMLPEKQTVKQTVTLPKLISRRIVYGKLSGEEKITIDQQTNPLLHWAREKGLMLCFVDPAKEPSKHILQDLPQRKKELEQWNGNIVLVTPEDKVTRAFNAKSFSGLPQQTRWTVDTQRELLKTLAQILHINIEDHFPFTLYINPEGEILYHAEGYVIGIGDTLLEIIALDTKQ
ncbi:MAG: transglutaminase domain-containing protein [Bacteroidales bacterium]|nr:transglutaminase domain-containing protein [Bacteroidales bacterium]